MLQRSLSAELALPSGYCDSNAADVNSPHLQTQAGDHRPQQAPYSAYSEGDPCRQRGSAAHCAGMVPGGAGFRGWPAPDVHRSCRAASEEHLAGQHRADRARPRGAMSPTPDFRLSRGWRLRSRSRLQAKASLLQALLAAAYIPAQVVLVHDESPG